VLAYQAWTYWVFRKRVGGDPQPPPQAPTIGQPTAASR
jgi:hypothetical protein